MPDAQLSENGSSEAMTSADWVSAESARAAGEMARLLATVNPDGPGRLSDGIQFLKSYQNQYSLSEPDADQWQLDTDDLHPQSPVKRLADRLGLTRIEIKLLLLAGMAEQHEGIADVLRMVNPEQKPRMAVGLAARLLLPDADRARFEQMLFTGPAVRSGLVRIDGDQPLYNRQLLCAEKIWPVLAGNDLWPAAVRPLQSDWVSWGLDSWFNTRAVADAVETCRRDEPKTVQILVDDVYAASHRAAALIRHSGGVPSVFWFPKLPSSDELQLGLLHCMARANTPVVVVCEDQHNVVARAPVLESYPGTLFLIGPAGRALDCGGRPVRQLELDKLPHSSLTEMWRQALPGAAALSSDLAVRFPVEPCIAAGVAADFAETGKSLDLRQVGDQVRIRAGVSTQSGVKHLRPRAGWHELVLKPENTAQLRESVDRLKYQSTVLNDWGFLKNRHGASGVRMLLAGPPGTGKTLTAEVLANELGVDLLIVDIARVVSKWIGETEKNLEQAFSCAERTRAVLLFDEADALFGKRTEVSDAHDRYANLETAYLLTRLERFEGLAIMSTNLRANIDPAFTRRMEYIVEYEEPGRSERHKIWCCHVPERAPLADDVSLDELAAVFPVVGGVIRNAAVAAAYRAASDGSAITRSHFIKALKREYLKQGKSFPGAELQAT